MLLNALLFISDDLHLAAHEVKLLTGQTLFCFRLPKVDRQLLFLSFGELPVFLKFLQLVEQPARFLLSILQIRLHGFQARFRNLRLCARCIQPVLKLAQITLGGGILLR